MDGFKRDEQMATVTIKTRQEIYDDEDESKVGGDNVTTRSGKLHHVIATSIRDHSDHICPPAIVQMLGATIHLIDIVYENWHEWGEDEIRCVMAIKKIAEEEVSRQGYDPCSMDRLPGVGAA